MIRINPQPLLIATCVTLMPSLSYAENEENTSTAVTGKPSENLTVTDSKILTNKYIQSNAEPMDEVELETLSTAGPEYLIMEDEESDTPSEASFQFDDSGEFTGRNKLNANIRSYYMNRSYDNSADGEALATGGWIDWQSPTWKNYAHIGATAYTSQNMFADDEYNRTQLLQNDEKSYSGISNIYLQLDHEELSARLGRFEINDPYMNGDDARMIPNSFQGAQGTFDINPHWMIGIGHFTEMKSTTSTSYDHLYEVANQVYGLDMKTNHGVSTYGLRYQESADHGGGLFYQHAPDFIDTIYIDYSREIIALNNGSIALAGQYTTQESVGNKIAGDFKAEHFGAKLTWQQGIVKTQLAYSYYSETAQLLRPWSASTAFNAIQWSDSDRPGEKGALIGVGIDLSELVTPGLTISTKYYKGNTPDEGTWASPDVSEWGVDIVYSVPQGTFKDLELRVRNASVKQKNTTGNNDADSLNDFRVIANYTWTF